MDWLMIVQLIMSIITVIMELIGGGTFTKVMQPDQAPVYRLAEGQFNCGGTYWTEYPRIENGQFVGTVALDCKVMGLSGGGLAQLKTWFEDQIPRNASRLHDGPFQTSVNGVPADTYDMTLTIGSESEVVDVRGETSIATDGKSRLSNTFVSSEIARTGGARYIVSVRDQVDVSTTETSGWYQVHMQYRAQVLRPGFVSEKTFRNMLVEKFEQKMGQRKDRVINDIAPNL